MRKIAILSGVFAAVVLLGLMAYLGRAYLWHAYQDIFLVNTSTDLFECNEFADEDRIKEIKMKSEGEYLEAKEYLEQNEASLDYREVGARCPGKYEFIAAFGSEWQRIEVKRILGDQRIEEVPVFLMNR